jgi:hypothetical protein
MSGTVYTRLQAVAIRLIKKYGRDVTIRFAADAAPADASRPWNPSAPTFTDQIVRGVVTPAVEDYVNGTTILATDAQVIVAARGLLAVPDPKCLVVDSKDGTTYKVTEIDGIDPGPIAVVYTIFMRK